MYRDRVVEFAALALMAVAVAIIRLRIFGSGPSAPTASSIVLGRWPAYVANVASQRISAG